MSPSLLAWAMVSTGLGREGLAARVRVGGRGDEGGGDGTGWELRTVGWRVPGGERGAGGLRGICFRKWS